MRSLPLFLLLAACAPDPFLADYAKTLTAMHAHVDDHATAMSDATSLDDVPALETAHQEGWATLMNDMTVDVDAMDCGMGGDGGMQGAMDTMDAMGDRMTGHMSGHDGHTDLSQCQAEEQDHSQRMNSDLADMGQYTDGPVGGMSCRH